MPTSHQPEALKSCNRFTKIAVSGQITMNKEMADGNFSKKSTSARVE